MRRAVAQTMSGVTLGVIGLSLWIGAGSAGPSTMAEPRQSGGQSASPRLAAPQRPARKPSLAPTTHPVPAPRPHPVAAVDLSGDLVNTAYGPIRVRITVKAGRITAARAIVHPQGDSTTEQINAYAVPALDQAAVAAQGGQLDTVSGATYTSEGYRKSLQSALDAAHRAGAL